MKILSMTATFGKLDGETLELSGGLNVITAPNEWGKSTWCAFLTAMLYGIDTRERTKSGLLAEKEKYQPWSGKPMEGSLRVLHQGRDITIQRRTRGRVPMGDFSARETATGLPVRELTAENCGQVLLGVEKSVFQRTGFLRFSDLPVKADDALRRRLNALVTTGDESGSAELLGSRLRELKNRCRYNHTGLIPECQSHIRQLQEQLWECRSLQQQHDSLMAQVEEQSARQTALENHRLVLQWQEAQYDRERIRDARADVRTAQLLEKALEERYTEKQDRAGILAKIRQGEERLEEVELSLEEAPARGGGIALTAFLAAALLIAALLTADRGLLIPCLVLAVIMFFVCCALISQRRQKRIWYNIDQTRRRGQYEELVNFLESWRTQLRVLDELERARENVTRTQRHLQDLEAMARTAEPPRVEDSLTLSREETMRALGEVSAQLDRSRTRLAQLEGKMEQLPDEEQLQRSLTLARHRLAELERTSIAIGYAQDALETAALELQRRFTPRITAQAGEFLSRLTGGAYDRIAINEDLSLLSAREGETTLREPHWRSEGTGDQMYLALRLAVWEALSPNSPLVLDDALVRFDQARMEKALELLKDLCQKRQILLFSCQEREKDYLNR